MERIKGFTLVELILAITLLGILVVVSGVLMGRGIDAYRLVTSRTNSLQQSRVAFIRMQKELERLRDVQVSNSQRVVFRDPDLNSVEFRLNGTTLLRNNDVLADGITNWQLTYFRDNGNETTAAPQVRRIHMEMTMQGDAASGMLDFRTDIFPRIFIYENYQ